MTTTNAKKLEKVTVVAPLKIEMAAMSKAAAALNLPPVEDRQPDLQYLTAIFVSSGMNKNGAVFMGSELVKARKSIANKAVDIEHAEQSIIGQITNSAYLTRDGNAMDAETASTGMTTSALDGTDMDIAVSCIIHKARFPEIAQEIIDGNWMVSMEAFFRDYDVKVGELIIPREQAAALGYEDMIGKVVRVKDGDKELGYHLVGRVLRDITFAGVGIVKNPANERSVILEAAALNEFVNSHKENASIVNLADISVIENIKPGYATSNAEIAESVRKAVREEMAGLRYNDMRPGTCVHFKKEVVDLPLYTMDEPATDLSQYPLFSPPGGVDSNPPGAAIVQENYCNLFGLPCTARPGDATMPSCWRNVFAETVNNVVLESDFEEIVRNIRSTGNDLVKLQTIIDNARKFRQ